MSRPHRRQRRLFDAWLFDNQKATEESFNKDGWFLSGDLGLIDENDCLRFVGRLKDIIIRGGKNIHPKKIEDLAIKHPNVEKAAAFPVPDERLENAFVLPSCRRATHLTGRMFLDTSLAKVYRSTICRNTTW